jgi:hypothetical protein
VCGLLNRPPPICTYLILFPDDARHHASSPPCFARPSPPKSPQRTEL